MCSSSHTTRLPRAALEMKGDRGEGGEEGQEGEDSGERKKRMVK